MKSLLAATCLAGAIAFSGVAFAAGNSTPGIDRYNETSQHPNDNAQCGSGAGSGAFGYFGKDNNLGVKSDPNDPGANGHQTGINNSSVCGNRQGNNT
jgi:hypothetical protein